MRASIGIALVTMAACGGGKPAAESPSGRGGSTAPFDGGQAGGTAVAEVLTALGQGDDAGATCFAWSASTGRVACAVDEGSIQGGATMAVLVLGDGGTDYVYYKHPEDQQYLELVPEGYHRGRLDTARAELTAGGFEPWTFAPVELEPGAELTVGDATLRRIREKTGEDGHEMTGIWETYADRVERRCGDRWVALVLPDDSFGNAIEPARIEVFATPTGALIATAAVSWGIEGDSGGGTDAMLLPACP